MLNLFTFNHYRKYLAAALDGDAHGWGSRSKLAQFIPTQVSFLSQVMTGRAHFSLEHALRTSEFLEHTPAERHYFILLVQKEKAGSKKLELYFEEQLAQIQMEQQKIETHVPASSRLSAQDQTTYYSHWLYVALHILSALPGTQTPLEMAKYLRVSVRTLEPFLNFLLEAGIIQKEEGRFKIGNQRVHLAQGEKLLPRHHANWRMKAIQAADFEQKNELHYSAVIGISKADVETIRAVLMKAIQGSEKILNDSKEQVAWVLLMDFFQLN